MKIIFTVDRTTFWNLYFSYYLLIKEICLLVSMMPFIPFRRRMQQGSVVVVFSGVIGQHMYPSNVELQNPVKIQIRCIWGMILQHIFLLQPIYIFRYVEMVLICIIHTFHIYMRGLASSHWFNKNVHFVSKQQNSKIACQLSLHLTYGKSKNSLNSINVNIDVFY